MVEVVADRHECDGKIQIKPVGDDFVARIFKVINGDKVGFAVYEKRGETYEFVGLLAEIGIENK